MMLIYTLEMMFSWGVHIQEQALLWLCFLLAVNTLTLYSNLTKRVTDCGNPVKFFDLFF
jgi:hypothetical protein